MNFISIEKISTREARKIRWILFGCIALAFVSIKFPLPKFDIMLNLFGIPCPFCGMSRAFIEFINLNFSKSIYYNPSSVILFPFLVSAALSVFMLSIFNNKVLIKFNYKTFSIAAIFILLMWVLNIFIGHH